MINKGTTKELGVILSSMRQPANTIIASINILLDEKVKKSISERDKSTFITVSTWTYYRIV